MVLPSDLKFGSFSLQTVWLFVLLGVLYFVFIVWYEAKRDGFSTEKILDVTFTTLGLSGLAWYLLIKFFDRLQVYYYDSIFLKLDQTLFSILLILSMNIVIWQFLSKRWHWSFYRLTDVFSLGAGYFLVIYSVGSYLTTGKAYYVMLLFLLVIIHNKLFRYRGYLIFSGVSFSLLILTLVGVGLIAYHPKGYLLLYTAFIIISLVNLYFRRKTSMPTRSFPKEFLDFISDKLKKKEKRLKEQDKILTEEDPYLQEGRADGNSEIMDEAILEDAQKELTDVKKKGIEAMLVQVKRALSFIKTGKYGVCEICGKPIDKARLQIFPEATRCLECSQRS